MFIVFVIPFIFGKIMDPLVIASVYILSASFSLFSLISPVFINLSRSNLEANKYFSRCSVSNDIPSATSRRRDLRQNTYFIIIL